MTILLTGSAGFIGSHVQDELIRLGHTVIGIDSLVGGFKRNINPQTIMYTNDVVDTEMIDVIFSKHKPDIVIHMAADATEGRSQFTPVSSTRNNLVGAVNVFTSAIRHGAKKIIFTSSMSVYGKQNPPFGEELKTQPVDVYGVNKAGSEKILQVLCEVHGLDWVIIRPHNVFGERQNIRDAYRNVVGIFMNRVMNNQPPIIYGDGEQVRSFTHIDNIVPCFIKALDIKNEIINVGPTETQTINQLAKTILKEFNSDLEPQFVPDRPREVKHAYCTNFKAEKLLDYKTIIDFETGIKKMAIWARELGYQPPVYLDQLELTKNAPVTWRNKLI